MAGRVSATVLTMAAAALLAVPASGQNQAQTGADPDAAWTLPRTPDGRPDFQGFWTTQTFTPLQRPEHLADKEFYTDEEAAELQQ